MTRKADAREFRCPRCGELFGQWVVVKGRKFLALPSGLRVYDLHGYHECDGSPVHIHARAGSVRLRG